MRTAAAARAPWQRRRIAPQTWLTAGMVAVVVIGIGILWRTGVISRATFGFGTARSTRGLIAVPVAPKAIPAFTKVTRDHFWDPVAQQLTTVYMTPQSVTPEILVKWSDIFGRVLDHDKPAGYVFTKADFLPAGTRPGIVAGIPAGKRALRVPADKVEGFYGLQPGDRFDLVATLPLDTRGRSQNFAFAGPYAQQLTIQAQLTNWQKQATVRVMAQNGVVVQGVTTRQVPIFSNSLTQGGVTRMRPIQEVVIAIAPGEVAKLTEAMAVEAKISAVPRSGRPDDPKDSLTPDLSPVSPFGGSGGLAIGTGRPGGVSMVENIAGGKRELTAVVVK